MELASADVQTLQYGPLWVLSALAGTSSRFHPAELEAFWDTIVHVALRTPQPTRELLTSLTTDRRGLLLGFELDDRPIVSGLSRVVAVLDQLDAQTSADFKLALMRIGMAVGRARGPYGRQLTFEDTQLLLLVAQLLEIEHLPPINDGVLV